MTELVLVTPDLDKEMRVEADVLNFAIDGLLLMKCEDERWRLVAYISKLLPTSPYHEFHSSFWPHSTI